MVDPLGERFKMVGEGLGVVDVVAQKGGGTCLIFVCGCANAVFETMPFLLQLLSINLSRTIKNAPPFTFEPPPPPTLQRDRGGETGGTEFEHVWVRSTTQ